MQPRDAVLVDERSHKGSPAFKVQSVGLAIDIDVALAAVGWRTAVFARLGRLREVRGAALEK